MKQLALVIALIAFPVVAAAGPPEHVVNDGGATLTLDCAEGGRLVVNGANNTVTLTGGCEKVVVNGSGNHVAIDGADKIVVTGNDNAVTWKKGWTKKAPKIGGLGHGNTITKLK